MPKGKARIGGFICPLGLNLFDKIDINLLIKFKKEKHPNPNSKELEHYKEVVCIAFERYVSAKNYNNVVTNTERRKVLSKIKVLSKQLFNALKNKETEKVLKKRRGLVDCLFSLDIGTKAVLYRTLPENIEPQHIKSWLEYSYICDHKKDTLSLLSHFSSIEPELVIPKQDASWVDPFLVYLVDDLREIWTSATGRKALGRTSFDAETADKRNYFAEYIIEVFIHLDWEPPKIGTIQDIVDRRKKLKNPVSVKE